MKSCPNFSRFGGFAAILMSLMPGADNHAQDVPVPKPQTAAAAATPSLNLTAFSPDGAYFAAATPEGRIKCGSTMEGARSVTLLLCNPRLLVFSHDSRFLAAAGSACGSPDMIVKVWRMGDRDPLCKVQTRLGEDPHISLSPDGLLLVTTGENSRINLWPLPKGTLKWSVKAERPVSQLAISKDGKIVIAIYTDGSVQRFPVP